MLEFQSRVDPWMAVRVMTYVGLLYEDLIREGQVQTGGRLPGVVPIVLYNGETPWRAACDIADLLEPVEGLNAYRPRLRYLLLDEGRYDEETLAAVQGLAGALFRLDRSRTPEALAGLVTALTAWLDSPVNAELRRAFAAFLRQVLLPGRLPGIELPQMNDLNGVRAVLSERVKEWTKEWERQGLERGLEQGLEQGLERGLEQGLEQGREREARLVCRLLERRLGPLPEELTAAVLALPLERLEALGEALLDFTDHSELEAWFTG